MVIVSASRIDAYDRFQFRIETPGENVVVTGDPNVAAGTLLKLGVSDPHRLLTHVSEWGSLELFRNTAPRN